MEVKDWSILLIRNTNKKDSILNRILYWIIWHGSRSKHNHCQLIRSFNGVLYICESTISGFVITKTYDKWLEEQIYKKREYKIINIPISINTEDRFYKILGNKYDAKYWHYIWSYFVRWITKNNNYWSGSKVDISSTNCWQSVAYIFELPNYYEFTGKYFENIS